MIPCLDVSVEFEECTDNLRSDNLRNKVFVFDECRMSLINGLAKEFI